MASSDNFILETATIPCLIKGENPLEQRFIIEIKKDESISVLKDAIKSKNSIALGDIDAKDLVLWKVEITTDENDPKMQTLINAHKIQCDFDIEKELNGEKLYTTMNVKDIEPIVGYISLVIDRPDSPTLDKLMQNFDKIRFSQVQTTLNNQRLFNKAMDTNCLRDESKVNYQHSDGTVTTSIFNARTKKLTMEDNQQSDSFRNFVIKASGKSNPGPNDFNNIRINGIRYEEFRNRVFFVEKMVQITSNLFGNTLCPHE